MSLVAVVGRETTRRRTTVRNLCSGDNPCLTVSVGEIDMICVDAGIVKAGNNAGACKCFVETFAKMYLVYRRCYGPYP